VKEWLDKHIQKAEQGIRYHERPIRVQRWTGM
jgi:hypothetical protein